MKWQFTNKATGIHYTLHGNHYLPDLELPTENEQPISLWGQRHLRYIRQHKRIRYTNLLTLGELAGYLFDIDRQATALFSQLVKQLAEQEGITEQLKAEDQMEWVRRMNSVRNRAGEIILTQLIYS